MLDAFVIFFIRQFLRIRYLTLKFYELTLIKPFLHLIKKFK